MCDAGNPETRGVWSIMALTTAAIALGSNLGDRRTHLNAAVEAVRLLDHTQVMAVSAWVETEPVGPVAQGPYLNGAMLVQTELGAGVLLKGLQGIEAQRGRNRASEQRWGPRTLDLDLLIYGTQVIAEPGLEVPHPRMVERAFVLVPLAEIAPQMEIPGTGLTVLAALRAL